MARKQVVTMAPTDKLAEVNAYMVGLFGDDPGTVEIMLNAYLDGQDPTVATHSVANCASVSAADAVSLANYLSVTPGCGSFVGPYSPAVYAWDKAFTLWGLKPVAMGP